MVREQAAAGLGKIGGVKAAKHIVRAMRKGKIGLRYGKSALETIIKNNVKDREHMLRELLTMYTIPYSSGELSEEKKAGDMYKKAVEIFIERIERRDKMPTLGKKLSVLAHGRVVSKMKA